MRINHLAVALLIVTSSLLGLAQAPDTAKVDNLAAAISHAEGFGKRHTIPSRYHNPGDLKAFSSSTPLAGQVRLGKAGHIVFKDDEAGKAALRDYIVRMVDGRSRHFRPNMTLNQVARVYAENWRPWVRVVSRELGVPPNTTLVAYLRTDAPPPPAALSFRPLSDSTSSPEPLPPAVRVPESPHVLDAVLQTRVDVPPLVQDAPQHRKLPRFHLRAVSYGHSAAESSVQYKGTSWQ